MPAGRANAQVLPAPVQTQPAQTRIVTPQRFDIAGVKAIAFPEVVAIFRPFTAKETTVLALVNAAKQVTEIYQKQGYALSFAFIPEQDFAGGVVRVVAVEGYVDTITIEGDAGNAEPKLREIAERIRADKPLRLATFEHYTQLMAQMPGMRINARATPPTQTDGAGSLMLKVSHQPYSISLGTEMRSSKPRAVVTGVVNDPITAGGRLAASALIGGLQGESFTAGSYSQMLGSDGLTLKADLSDYRGNPDAQLVTPPAIRRLTTNKRAELSATYPLVLRQSHSLFLSGGVYAVNNADEYLNPANGLMLIDDVRARALYMQTAYNSQTDDQSRSLTVRAAQGIKGLGASSAIRTNAPGTLAVNPAKLNFTRLLMEGRQSNTWDKVWGTAVSFSTQYTPHILPSSERVSYGSSRFGRAYAAGVVAGDSGWGLGLEANRSFVVEMEYLKRLQPYVLLERARVYSNFGGLAFSQLASASVGIRVSDGVYYTADVALSKPVGFASPDNPGKKLRLSTLFSYNFERR